MIPSFGKQTLSIGSHPQCDIALQGPGVAPEHARIVNQGGGKLVFTNLGAGTTFVDNRPMAAGESTSFDFRQQFRLGDVPLPLDHPAIAASLMAVGQEPLQPGRLVIGRDPSRVSLVLSHPSVSSLHCTVAFDRGAVIDHDSTSGTYVNGAKLPGGQPMPLPPQGTLYLGPVPIRVDVLQQAMQALRPGGAVASPAPQPAPAGFAPQVSGAQPVAASPQGQVGGAPMRKHKTVFGQLDFSTGGPAVRTIGRTPGNDIVVAHPQVSSRHAQVEHHDGRVFVTDLGSANGTYVNGHRLPPGQKVEIANGQKIYVGPMPLQLQLGAGGAFEVVNEAYAEERWAGRPLYEIEAWQLYLEVPDRDDKAKMKVLLDNVSFKALPGDMIALMGPSGAGKTTLLLTLNGYLPPSQGLVRINGEDLYSIYDLLRGSIGYVPQDDLVHAELTVYEAVRYSAKLRLPPDYSDEEIDARVNQTLRDLGLDSIAHLEIGAPEKKVLSGGQRKRVNIALELVTDPIILYLDEPTSGLAADDAASLIHLLNGLTKATGKTIIMTIHQPAKEEYEKFTHALVLGYGGVPMFFGPTLPDSYRFFSGYKHRTQGKYVEPPATEVVDNPRDMFGNIAEREGPIHKQLLAQNPTAPRSAARNQAAMIWRAEYYSDSNPIYQKMYSGRRSVGTAEGQRGIPASRPQTSGQFGLLLARYLKTKVRDVSGTAIMFAQAPIIGTLLAIVFGSQEKGPPGWCLAALHDISERKQTQSQGPLKFGDTQDHTSAIFFLVVSAIWFGTSNAAREIVRERAIYVRERMVNLGLLNYVMSKFILLSLFCVAQCTMLLGIVFFALGFDGGMGVFAQQLAALIATSITSVAVGLLLSTLVTSSEAAMALTPIALIPQVVLGGLMVPAKSLPNLAWLMNVTPARWGFEAAIVPERLAIKDQSAWLIDLKNPELSIATEFIKNGKFECAMAQVAAKDVKGGWLFTNYEQTFLPYAVQLGMALVVFAAILVLLRRRDQV
ncbi:MAG: FHA domain-containing protein [Deltaproteobacteria bacterium]|nr:FHA domain-containing protein [Deltaproteobacteria bacterium]